MKIVKVQPGLVTLSLTMEDCEGLSQSLEQSLVETVAAEEAAMVRWVEAALCVFVLCARLGRVLYDA